MSGVIHETRKEAVRAVHQTVDAFMTSAVKACNEATNLSGTSIVIAAISNFWNELANLDPEATAVFFRTYADWLEPGISDEEKSALDARRREAIDKLFALTDLHNAKPKGRA